MDEGYESTDLNSVSWILSRRRGQWISVSDIPPRIFWSVWDIIDRNGYTNKNGNFIPLDITLHPDLSLFSIKPTIVQTPYTLKEDEI